MTKRILFIILLFCTINLRGKEFRYNVSVSSSKVEGTYKQVFESMRKDIYEFLNNHKWSDNIYTMDERIECNIFIQITDQVSADEFKGTMQVLLNMPVFTYSYESPILNINDNDSQLWYVEFNPLEFVVTSNTSSLTTEL